MAETGPGMGVAVRTLQAGSVLLAAAAAFHFLASPHITVLLQKLLSPRAYGFLEPVVSFTFVLNAVLLLPLAFSTWCCAAGLRRGEPWALRIGLVNSLTVLALPVLIVGIVGFRYFADAPLFVAGAGSVAAAGVAMTAAVIAAWRGQAQSRP